MALAQQLAELALANSQGLLNDDEYRLLRHNLFEQHSKNTHIPVEAPILPVITPSWKSSSPPAPQRRVGQASVQPHSLRSSSTHSKTSITASITDLLRRATGRKTPVSAIPDPKVSVINDSSKRGVFPRILHRKASKLFPSRTSNNWDVNMVTGSPKTSLPLSEPSHIRRLDDRSPRLVVHTRIPTFPSTRIDSSPTNNIFDDGNLRTAKDIRAAIIATEAEAQRIIEAFDGLESTTSSHAHQHTLRRLRSAAPVQGNVPVGQRERGDNWPQPSPLPLISGRKSHRRVPTSIEINDGASIRSRSSSTETTLSRSKSISSLRGKHPSSPLSSRYPPSSASVLRKNSVASISSQAPSASSRLGVTSGMNISRSTGHLPLTLLPERGMTQSMNTVGATEHTRSHSEISEIQRRKEEVMERYTARLEYLRAKLKGAELHEKLLRR